ncbi:Glutaredoxin 3 (Grx3), partial [Sideroxydans sp. CL21]
GQDRHVLHGSLPVLRARRTSVAAQGDKGYREDTRRSPARNARDYDSGIGSPYRAADLYQWRTCRRIRRHGGTGSGGKTGCHVGEKSM